MKLIIIISIIKTKEKLFNFILPVLTLMTRFSFLLLLYSMMTKTTRVTNAENRRTKTAVCVESLGVSSCCTILASEITTYWDCCIESLKNLFSYYAKFVPKH